MSDLLPSLTLPPRAQSPPDLTIEVAECLILTVPAWFAREDFLDWRQGRAEGQWSGPACWFPGDRTGDYTDVFLTFDCSFPPHQGEPGTEHLWEGSDADTLPFDLYEAIGQLLKEHGLNKGLLWLKPL
jgi:hypothetical protein